MKSKPKSPKRTTKKTKVATSKPVRRKRKTAAVRTEPKVEKASQTLDFSFCQNSYDHLPPWLREYARRHPDVNYYRHSLDLWRAALMFLHEEFVAAHKRGDGNLLKNPQIASALHVLMDEPRELAIKFFYKYPPERRSYGGDYEKDFERITVEWYGLFEGKDWFGAYADWFNEMFKFAGEPIATWVVFNKTLDSSPIFAEIKKEVSRTEFQNGAPQFPDPYGVARTKEEVKEESRGIFGAGWVRCVHPAFRQLLQLAWIESGFRNEREQAHWTPGVQHNVGGWAKQWIDDYDPEHMTLKFKRVELNFQGMDKRWEHVQMVVESEATDGSVQLGNGWRGFWNSASGPIRDFSRCIRPVKKPDGVGWFHLTGDPLPEVATRGRQKWIAQKKKA